MIDFLRWNMFLALIPVVMAIMFWWLTNRQNKHPLRWVILLVWVVFLPNTAYLLTDLVHFSWFYRSFGVTGIGQLVLVAGVGIITYLISIRLVMADSRLTPIIHLLVGIGVVMGRFMRTNSWYVMTDPLRVIQDFIAVIGSPLLLWVVFLTAFIWMTSAITFSFLRRRVSSV